MSRDEEVRKLLVETQFLEATAESLQSRMNFVNAALADLRMARMSIEGLMKEEKDAQLIVPIGGGSYIKVRLDESDLVIAGIGANVAVEKPLPDALERIKKRTEELEKTARALREQLTQVALKINDNRTKLRELAGERR